MKNVEKLMQMINEGMRKLSRDDTGKENASSIYIETTCSSSTNMTLNFSHKIYFILPMNLNCYIYT